MTVADPVQRYRKLPGQRRGLVSGASLWSGSDHLLSVKSNRFQENYKRFYYRDIQAIVVTRVPRFLISTRSLAAGALLLAGLLFARFGLPGVSNWIWLLPAVLAAAWIYVSAAHSCTCRLYTAVSREDLPSVYRTWTARRVLAELEQRIGQAQGVFTESWAAAADVRPLGPAEAAGSVPTSRRPAAARNRTLVSDVFVASLFADAAATLLEMSHPSPLISAVSVGSTVLQLATGVGILVQRYRGDLRAPMQRLAIGALLFVGGFTYALMASDSFEAALRRTGQPIVLHSRPLSNTLRPIYSGGVALLAIAGLVLSFKSTEPELPPAVSGSIR